MTVTFKISSRLRSLADEWKIEEPYDTEMYATTMYLVLIKISSFYVFPSLQPVLLTLVNYMKVVQ